MKNRDRSFLFHKLYILSLPSLALAFLIMGLVAMGGCRARLYDEINYQYPNWTPEGLIYAQKAITHRKEYGGSFGGTYHETLGTDYYYVTMDTDGKNEVTLPYNSYPLYSPKGTYVALLNGSKISIIKRSDNTKVYEFSPTTESISELDWGPNEDKLVYETNKYEAFISNIDGQGINKLTAESYSVKWKYGDRILIDTIYTVISINSSNNTDVFEYLKVQGGEYNISKMNTNEVIYRSAHENGIKKFHLNSVLADPVLLINRNDLWNIRLSPDGQKIVASGNNIVGEQIWIVNIDGSNIKQLK